MKFKLTKENFLEGEPGFPSCCVLSKALNRFLDFSPFVCVEASFVCKGSFIRVTLDDDQLSIEPLSQVCKLIEAFDDIGSDVGKRLELYEEWKDQEFEVVPRGG